MKDFQPLLQPTPSPTREQLPSFLSSTIKESLTLPTLLAIGGLIQCLVFAFFPARYSFAPIIFLLGRAVVTTILHSRSPKSNQLMVDVIPGRSTAQIPVTSADGTTTFGSTAASSPVLAFHLGVYFNHPLGPLAPGAREIGDHFVRMSNSLKARSEDFGLLSSTTWRGAGRASNNSILMIAYFRDAEGLNRFAHDQVHRDGWAWYTNFVKTTGYHHLGLYHESFVSRKGEWETIYIDCEPTLLGAGSVPMRGGNTLASEDGQKVQGTPVGSGEDAVVGKTEDKWIRPIVSADHPALSTQAKRLGDLSGLKQDV